MVGNFLGDQAAGVLHIQMKYKYKRMIFFLNPGDGHICKAHQSNVFEITPGGLIDFW